MVRKPISVFKIKGFQVKITMYNVQSELVKLIIGVTIQYVVFLCNKQLCEWFQEITKKSQIETFISCGLDFNITYTLVTGMWKTLVTLIRPWSYMLSQFYFSI